MIYDVFPFFHELDLLELRLTELDTVVDKFVLSESSATYSGLPKRMHFADNRKRYAKWLHKIIYWPVNGLISPSRDPWVRETLYRNAMRGAFTPNDDDIITYTDADEIPHPTVYQRFNPADGVNALDMMFLMYYMDARIYIRWRFGRICTGKFWRECHGPHWLRFKLWSPTAKNKFWIGPKLLPFGGWHFSWLGTRESRILKTKSTSHCFDAVRNGFLRKLEKGDPTPDFGPGKKSQPVKIDLRWPKTVRDNIDHFRQLGFIYN